MRGAAIGWLLTAVVLSGCQSAPEGLPAVSDGMSCPQVVEVVEAALERGQRFVAAEESDALLASDLVFALSGADERPECLDAETRSRAAGMRATINGTSG